MTYQYPVAPQPKKSKTWLWVLLAVVGTVLGLCLVGALVVGGAASSVQQEQVNRSSDVKLTSCDVDEFDIVSVKYTIHNSSKSSNLYTPTFDVLDSTGTKIGEASGITTVASGQNANDTAVGTITSDNSVTSVKCVLTGA